MGFFRVAPISMVAIPLVLFPMTRQASAPQLHLPSELQLLLSAAWLQ
jgi:hypothetical protein